MMTRTKENLMSERLSYDELSEHFLRLFTTIASGSNPRLPVFSGDISVALKVRHRIVKDIIEAHFLELRQVYGKSIQVVRYKRRYGRAMRGYLLPFCAAAQLLPYLDTAAKPLLAIPEVLHSGFGGNEWFFTTLN